MRNSFLRSKYILEHSDRRASSWQLGNRIIRKEQIGLGNRNTK